MTGQTRKHSLIESLVNITIGYGIAVTAQIMIFPYFDIRISHNQNMEIAAIFTVISLIHSYCLSRLFNRIACRNKP